MECPYCNKTMVTGRIEQDRYALKWIPEDEDKWQLNSSPYVKGIKLTSLMKGSFVTTYFCKGCKKLIINQEG